MTPFTPDIPQRPKKIILDKPLKLQQFDRISVLVKPAGSNKALCAGGQVYFDFIYHLGKMMLLFKALKISCNINAFYNRANNMYLHLLYLKKRIFLKVVFGQKNKK